MNVEAKGFAELDRMLQQLPDDMARIYLVDAVRAGGELIAEEAARRAPRDTGDLAASITVKVNKNVKSNGDPEAQIGPSKKEQRVGRYQELGTSHNPAQPFLRPALDTRGQDAIEAMRDVLKQHLDNLKVPTL